ncbi:hypothetical protein AYI69_g9571 [Smittium culicis]|uniref:Uncharacterized protein n=1 Tax=Smittium culicis TaxID=133412 RepID=A0A1R1XBQ8_9FUNG|nr:hypothetical protein AYI69_g9571 [Smittium culicis]
MEQALLDTIATLTKKVEDLLVRQHANTVEDDVNMIYTPPPINDAATAPIKKLDTAYYIVQAFLAQATMPVVYYVHQFLQDEPEAPTNDPRFLFASTMRLILSEACTLLTQARLDNLNSGLNLPGRHPQLNLSSNEPLMDPAVLSELMATKKPTKSGRKKLFRGRQQQADSETAPKTVTIAATAPVTNQTNLADGSNQQFANYKGGFRGGRGGYATSRNNRQWILSTIEQTPATDPASQVEHETHGAQISQDHDVGDCGSAVEKGNREGIPAITWILLEYIHGSKEIRGTSSCSRHEATERTPEDDTLQKGISDVHHQDDPQEGLLEVLALSMERESIPVPDPTIWDVPITAVFYQNPPSSNTMGSPARDKNFRLPGLPFDNGVVKRKIFEINNVCFEKIGPTRLQNQQIKIIFSAHSVHSAPRYEDQNQVHDASGTRKQGPRPPENSNRNDKSRDDSGDTSGAPEAPQTYGVEDQLFKGKPEMRIDSHNNGASIRESDLLEGPNDLMEWELLPSRNFGTGDIYRCQRHWLGGRCSIPDLLRFLARAPHKIAYQCKRIADNIICCPTPLSCWTLGHLHPVSNEPGRCAIDDDCPDRMGDLPYRLQGNPGPVRKQRHRSSRVSKKHATGEILQLVPQKGSRSYRRLYAAMVSMEGRVLLPTVELDHSSNSESLQRTVDTITSNPTVTIGNVVSRPNEVGNPETNILTGNSGGARPQKRQVAFDEEQVLVFNGLAHKRRALLGQGLENQAIDIILSNPRTDKRMRHYDPTQQRFLAWHINQGIIRPINAAEIFNLLAKSFAEDKLALSTIKAYKSALLHVSSDPSLIALAHFFTNFFAALRLNQSDHFFDHRLI